MFGIAYNGLTDVSGLEQVLPNCWVYAAQLWVSYAAQAVLKLRRFDWTCGQSATVLPTRLRFTPEYRS